MSWSCDKLKASWPFSRRAKRHGAVRPTLVLRAKPACHLSGRFDSAQTTPDNRRHWANADHLAADAAANPEVRRILRSRARYEVANNSYARGIVLTLANDVTGTGPRLQMLSGDGEVDRRIEVEFARWARTVGLAEKLRTMRVARAKKGETGTRLLVGPVALMGWAFFARPVVDVSCVAPLRKPRHPAIRNPTAPSAPQPTPPEAVTPSRDPNRRPRLHTIPLPENTARRRLVQNRNYANTRI